MNWKKVVLLILGILAIAIGGLGILAAILAFFGIGFADATGSMQGSILLTVCIFAIAFPFIIAGAAMILLARNLE